ncbi:MAG: preprotein translocase subunit SecE [Bacilli bacterium]|nr:preprotein translocase subunit SecE [Bacilli bacterium]
MVKGKKIEKKNVGFWDEVNSELKKVKWLSKKEMIKYTVTTLCFIVLFALYFFGLETIFAFIKGLIG